MTRRLFLANLFLWLILPTATFAKDRFLQGRVLLVGEHDELKPLAGQDVVLIESGDSARTKEGGRFRLFLKDIFKSGTRVTLSVKKKDWRIQYPLDGEARVPDDLDKELVDIRLLPVGSKKFWSADRIEKFIRDTAEKSKEQVRLEGKPQEIDFSRYIKDWAGQYGFSVQQAKAEIDKWVAESEKKNDLYQLGLAAYAKKNFGQAGKLFEESAGGKIVLAEAATTRAKRLTEEAVRDYRLAGNAYYANYNFKKALTAYEAGLSYASKNDVPALWATLQWFIGLTNWEIGIRTKGSAIKQHLDGAVKNYEEALSVFKKTNFPENWAAIQNNIGLVLRDQSTRTGGETSIRLLTEAVTAYREALKVYTKNHFPQQWATAQKNLSIVLLDQADLAKGKDSVRLLAQAVDSNQAALTVLTRQLHPQQWAMTQGSLAIALQKQGSRDESEAGALLLAQSVDAYRNALIVFTKEAFPQDWAKSHNNLGIALSIQGARTDGRPGIRLLAQAIDAFRAALTVYTEDSLPQL
ncbi:MAG: hypothetical protein KF876_09595 [Nitrospira sp.]|nr:hypothetical protein [Nitrospira sp.]